MQTIQMVEYYLEDPRIKYVRSKERYFYNLYERAKTHAMLKDNRAFEEDMERFIQEAKKRFDVDLSQCLLA